MKVTDRQIRMISKSGFIEVFWESLKEGRKSDPKLTQQHCYEFIEKEYQEAFHRRRYANFISFRRRLND